MDGSLELSVSAFKVSFQRDVEAFLKNLPDLLRDFPGQYVAIRDGEIVGKHAVWSMLIAEMEKRFPDEYVLVEQIVPQTQEVVHMDTVE